MPASRNASPCSSHHRPTVPSCSRLGKRLVGEIAGDFFGRKIDVGKDHDARLRLLDHLRAPTRFAAGVEPFAAVETHQFQDRDQVRERRPAGAVRVMIVIRPTEARAVLPFVLHAAGAVAALPILAFGGEEQIARPIGAELVGRRCEQFDALPEIRLRVRRSCAAGGEKHPDAGRPPQFVAANW